MFLDQSAAPCLTKPCTVAEIRRAIQQVLEASDEGHRAQHAYSTLNYGSLRRTGRREIGQDWVLLQSDVPFLYSIIRRT